MTTPMKHSPLPWNRSLWIVLDASDKTIFQPLFDAKADETTNANLDLAVHAVNNIERIEAENAQLKAVNEKLAEALKPFTAAQRAEAFLKTLGLWENEKGDL